jgi:uncharacterized membrane protein YqjE
MPETPPSSVSLIMQLVTDHFRLLHLEWTYEKEEGRRRLCFGAFAVLCLIGAFTLGNVALIDILLRQGIALYQAAFAMAGLWTVMSLVIYQTWIRRDPRVGRPFDITRRELKESAQWIRTRFS